MAEQAVRVTLADRSCRVTPTFDQWLPGRPPYGRPAFTAFRTRVWDSLPMKTDVDAIICRAIRERRWLLVDYGDTRRVVQPHVYGDDHAGDRLLSAYQVSGGSTSGAPQGWKSFRMDRVTQVALGEGTFHGARPEFQRNDGAFARIVCQLDGL